jgi:hypothetical protein
MAMLTMHVYEPPPQPRVLNPDLSPLLEAVLLRALEKDPNQRYQTATEMVSELTRVAARLDRTRPSSRITSLYQAGVEAFEQERWDDAVERFRRLIAIDPNYEDATILLRASQAAQARATQQGSAVAPISTPPPNDNQPILDAAAPTTIAGPPLKASPITGKQGDNASKARAEVTPAGSAPADREVRCPQCGQGVRAEWQACPFCRTPINQAIANEPQARADTAPPVANAQAATSKPGWQRWAIIAGVVLLIGGGAGGAWAWSRRTTNPAIVPPLVITTASASPTSISTPTVSPLSTTTPTPRPSATPQPTATPPQPTDTPQPTETPRLPDAVVTNTQQRLRSGPGQNYANLGTYTQGATLTITGKDATGAWIQVTAPDGKIGWMLASDMQINLAMSDIAVVAAPPSPTSAPTPKPKPKPTLTPEPPTLTPTLTPEPPTLTPEPPTLTPTPTRKPSHNDGGCTKNCNVPPP